MKQRKKRNRIIFSYIGIFAASLFCIGSMAAWFTIGGDGQIDDIGMGVIDINEEKSVSMGINSSSGETTDSASLLPGEIQRFSITINNSDSAAATGTFSITGAGDDAGDDDATTNNPTRPNTIKTEFLADSNNQNTSLSSEAQTTFVNNQWTSFCSSGRYLDLNTNEKYVLTGSQTFESIFMSIAEQADIRDAIKVAVAYYDSTWNNNVGGYVVYDYVNETNVAFNASATTYSTNLFSMTLNDYAAAEAANPSTNPTYQYSVPGATTDANDVTTPGTTNVYVIMYFDPTVYVTYDISGGTSIELQNSNPFYYQSVNITFNTVAD